MKVALITDIHFDARQGSVKFAKYQNRFFDEVFIPFLKENNISCVIDLGDTFDRRRNIDFTSIFYSKKVMFDPLREMGVKCYVIVGNHDAQFKNTIEMNSVDILLSEYENVSIIDRPQTIQLEFLDVCMIPWICVENLEEVNKEIDNTPAKICMGHLELSGFEMYAGSPIEHGFDPKMFSKFQRVFSGHFHHKSSGGNIDYLGSPFEMTWQDYNDPKGFHVFDTETLELEWIKNPFKLFHKIFYNDENKTMENVLNVDFDKYMDTYVKVIVTHKGNPFYFDTFMEKLQKSNPINVTVVDDHKNMGDIKDEDFVSEAEDTLTILKTYIESLNTENGKQLNEMLTEIYHEAHDLES